MRRLITWLRERAPLTHPGFAEILAWSDETSGARQARRVALHLVTCARCRRQAELLREARHRQPLPAAEGDPSRVLEEGLQHLRANMRAWRCLQEGASRHPRSSL